MNVEPFVFVSYFREDIDKVRSIVARLTAAGVPFWIDEEGMEAGEAWRRKIEQKINDASIFLICNSKSYALRPNSYVHQELQIAVARAKGMDDSIAWIVPLSLDGSPPINLQIDSNRNLQDLHWTDHADRPIEQMVSRILAVLSDPRLSKAELQIFSVDLSSANIYPTVDSRMLRRDGTWTPVNEFREGWESWGYQKQSERKFNEVSEFPAKADYRTLQANGIFKLLIEPGTRVVQARKMWQAFHNSYTRTSYPMWFDGQSNSVEITLKARETALLSLRKAPKEVRTADELYLQVVQRS